jgi:hypothetical protein
MKLLLILQMDLERTVKPIAVDIVPMITAIDHSMSMHFLLLPLDFMPSVEANPSGKFEIKIAAMRTIFTAPPVTKEIPRAIFSGILSMTEPTSNANPDADFPPPAFLP